jgi:hypothetical protein
MVVFLLQAAVDSTAPARRLFDAVGGFTDYILDYAIALAAVGALAMALIEAGKKLLDSRTKFHARRWTSWMMKSGDGKVDIADRRQAYADLIQLCTGVTSSEADQASSALIESDGRLTFGHGWDPSPAHAVFSLETARMMGAIQEAGDTALAAPRRYSALFRLLTAGAEQSDIDLWLAEGHSAAPRSNDEGKTLADAFSRLRQIFKRKLDAFQLYTEQRWATYNQFWANALGAVIMAAALWQLRHTYGVNAAWLLVLSLFGGILSPIAKDMVSALRRVRNG